jgi:hypothetical protein
MMAPQSLALQRCFDEVAHSAPLALERCLTHVVSALQEAEGTSTRANERIELGDAWRELLQHQATWCERYPDELRAAFDTAVKPKAKSRAAQTRRAQREPRELSLVDECDIVEAIESSRLVQNVMPLVERPVSELDALMSTAMGLPTVRPELNPIRPEIFARSLRALIGRTSMKPATGSLWMKHMAEPLGQELQTLYGRLLAQLKDANVQAAGYRVHSSAAAPTSGVGSFPPRPSREQREAPDPASAASQYASPSSRQISHALLREFLTTGGGAQAEQALPVSYYAEIDCELASLERQGQGQGDAAPPPELPDGYRELPVVERPQLPVGVQSTLDPQAWGEYAHSHERSLVRTRLRREAQRVAQVLGLELVRKVVNQVAQDPRLLAPVREAIVALEPSLLRLAMVDPRFFSDESHCGRWLMERVAQRSFKYNDEFSNDFAAFFEGVRDCFKALNDSPIESVQPFEQALAVLEAAWTEQDSEEEAQRSSAVDAIKFAERRQAEADRIASELSSRPDLDGVPPVVQDFLFGPWTLVLAHARLTDAQQQLDPGGYRDVISDLLWSVKREVTLKQPAQLFRRVPPLVAKLRAGLASLGQEPEESDPFFQVLMKLHKPVLKLRRAKSRRDAREYGLAPPAVVEEVAAAPVLEPHAKLAGQPWMSPRELNAVAFEETLPADMGALSSELPGEAPRSPPAPLPLAPELVFECTPEPERTQVERDPESILASLREGDWVDLYSKRRWLRAQLIWSGSKATLFMFVSHGGQPHSMTRRICERLIRDRFLRPVRMHGVVAQALDALEQEETA